MKRLYACKKCGALLDVKNSEEVLTCSFCGRQDTVPENRTARILDLFDKGQGERRAKDFAGALKTFDTIIQEAPEAEAYFSRFLCTVKVQYVENPVSHSRTVRLLEERTTPVTEDPDYKEAVARSSGKRRDVYQADAEEIETARLAMNDSETVSGTAEKKETQAKKKKWLIPVILGIVIGLAVVYNFVISPAMQYSEANHLMETGNYGEAEKIYRSLDSYRNSEALSLEASYQYAGVLTNAGQYDQALVKYEELGSYLDSEEKAAELKEKQ